MTAIRGIFAPIETLLARRSELVVVISVAALFIVFSTTVGENFLSNLAISNIVTFSTILGIIVLGVAVLMISGEFDLSVGSMFAVVGFTLVSSWLKGLDPWLAAGISVAAGALLGFLNGIFVVGSGNPSFIITLGLLLGYRGVARSIGGGSGVSVSYDEGASPVLFDILNSAITPLNMLSELAGNCVHQSLVHPLFADFHIDSPPLKVRKLAIRDWRKPRCRPGPGCTGQAC